VPAGAVIQNPQALSGIIGRKVSVGGDISLKLNTQGSTLGMFEKLYCWRTLEVGGTVGVGVKSVDIDRNTKCEGIQLERS
jgi:hypothetical protein